MASRKKHESNRINSQRSTGPRDSSRSRYNSLRHGLLSRGLTELDDVERHEAILKDLTRRMGPVGELEASLITCIALDLSKLERARQLEAEFVTSKLHPREIETDSENDPFAALPLPKARVIDPGFSPSLGREVVEQVLHTYERYQTLLLNRILRSWHELERLQRLRGGERLPAPLAVDVTLHGKTETSTPFVTQNSATTSEESQGGAKATGMLDLEVEPNAVNSTAAGLPAQQSDADNRQNLSNGVCAPRPKNEFQDPLSQENENLDTGRSGS